MIPTVPYSVAVSKLRRPFLSDQYFFIVVGLLKQLEKLGQPVGNARRSRARISSLQHGQQKARTTKAVVALRIQLSLYCGILGKRPPPAEASTV
jgi:hypothetical protein